MLETSLLAVFITGLLGGVHCAGMCGGIVSVLAMQGRRSSPSAGTAQYSDEGAHATESPHKRKVTPAVYPLIPVALAGSPATTGTATATAGHRLESATQQLRRTRIADPPGFIRSAFLRVLLYNVGRLGTYTLLGALAGAVGSIGWWMQSALPIQQAAFAVTNILLVLMGLYLAGWRMPGILLESAGRHTWRFVQPHASRYLTARDSFSAIAAGGLWGLVPCGMVYAVLIAALVSGSALDGALLMAAFGLGTLPNLMLLGLSGQWLMRFRKRTAVRRAAGGIVIAFGVLGLMKLDMVASLPLIKNLCVHLP